MPPRLLELRIHGVRNTPPHEMLGAAADEVRMARGDRLAGFYTYAAPAPRSAPPGRRVEAYAWGGLARYTGLPRLGRAGDGVVKALWFAAAPFGLANTAYWSRTDVGSGRGAGALRVFGLLLTLLFVTTATTVALDMAAAQCFTPGTGALTCARARIVLGPLAGLAPAARATALLAVPLLALGALAVLPMLGRTRYIAGPAGARRRSAYAAGTRAHRPGGGREPFLARRDAWRAGPEVAHLKYVHAGAALAWLAALVAGGRAGASGAWLALLVAALAVVLGGGGWLARPRPSAGPVARQAVYAGAGGALFVAAAACNAADHAAVTAPGVGALTCTVLLVGIALTLGVILVQGERSARGRARDLLGWRGRGPFVFAAHATGFALLLSFAVVLLAAWALGGPRAPDVYLLQGAGFVALAALSVVALGAWYAAALTRPGVAEIARIRERLVADLGEWTVPPAIDRAARAVHRATRRAGLVGRLEPIVGALAWAIVAALCLGLVLLGCAQVGLLDAGRATGQVLGALGTAGLWVAAGAVLAVAILSPRADARPLGVLWDLMCFVPTRAHPFGPPCYGERVVPELADRIVDWFAAGDRREPRAVVLSAHSMGALLAIATIFQLRARGLAEADLARVALLSYGCQVRPIFSRFFPAVCGPAVLDIVPAGPAAPGSSPPGALRDLLGRRWRNVHRPTDPLGFPVRYRAADADVRAAVYREGASVFAVATHADYLQSAAYRRAFAALRRIVLAPAPGP